MILRNLRLMEYDESLDIEINNGKIVSVANQINKKGPELALEKAVAFPGLINSHDHLDFNLFPQLGNEKYNNYKEWGTYLHKAYKKEIDYILKIPKNLRYQWGIYKNLLCGVTTVINHGDKINILNPLISVYQQTQNLHSVGFEKFWKLKLNNLLKINASCTVHIGEGVDAQSYDEIDQLINWNLLKRKLIGIHGIAMDNRQAKYFKALVWCPVSNQFMFGRTASINELYDNTTILFGTDSTLTADWNIWNHLRVAKDIGSLSDEELYRSITHNPSQVWKLKSGSISENKVADIVIVKSKQEKRFYDLFYSLQPEDILIVLQKGQIRLFDQEMKKQVLKQGIDINEYSCIEINGQTKYVQGEISLLVKEIKKYNSSINFPVSEPFLKNKSINYNLQ
jgi:cytosine/adenosine deaminase-related metal-dependent hydrolase